MTGAGTEESNRHSSEGPREGNDTSAVPDGAAGESLLGSPKVTLHEIGSQIDESILPGICLFYVVFSRSALSPVLG